MSPVENDKKDNTKNMVDTKRVGKRGTRLVCENSIKIGTPRMSEIIRKIRLIMEKNGRGLYSRIILKIVSKTFEPSRIVRSLDWLP